MQQKAKKVYSPLRNRNTASSSQTLEHPVLFKNSSIDGSKDAVRESRSRSKSSEKVDGRGSSYQQVRTSSQNDQRGAKHSGAGAMRRSANQRLLSGERSHGQGLKFVRPGLKNSARNSRSPVDDQTQVDSAGMHPYPGSRDRPQMPQELKGILMNNNYVRDASSGQRYGGAYGPNRSNTQLHGDDDEVISAKSGPGQLGGGVLGNLSQQHTSPAEPYIAGSQSYEHNNTFDNN